MYRQQLRYKRCVIVKGDNVTTDVSAIALTSRRNIDMLCTSDDQIFFVLCDCYLQPKNIIMYLCFLLSVLHYIQVHIYINIFIYLTYLFIYFVHLHFRCLIVTGYWLTRFIIIIYPFNITYFWSVSALAESVCNAVARLFILTRDELN